ncbi:peptide ABC transporter permease [Peribacillus asahii]|uniref:Peptide ABC transporter permease n=1 Tax=Peribacillus asahii TaxID=228899 RepID=A0A3Q9RL55_9BACI|nr:ABC transporter permease [Peribacillus asahii]AZV42031.1 peptide ABC transporter permease [Peribacillus asahii]USK86361.1 ABC transporter permease [Peribacillus asahii]
MELNVNTEKHGQSIQITPSGRQLIWQQMKKDRLAMGSFIFLVSILLFVYSAAFVMDAEEIARINLRALHQPPSLEHWLGTDYGGRDVFGQLIIGTRNSFTISFCITLLTALIGLTTGLVAGYFGGVTDHVVMRIIDFIISLPTTMFIIVLVTIIPEFTIWSFILVMTLFYWTGKARLIRSKVLAERELDYVQASQTLGTPHWKIMFFQIFPNVSSIIIVNFILNLAGNIGLESALTYLGFGLPESTPSLGTLISYARNPDVLEHKWWVWLPASVMILVMMLSINFVGQAIKRATDARQRR